MRYPSEERRFMSDADLLGIRIRMFTLRTIREIKGMSWSSWVTLCRFHKWSMMPFMIICKTQSWIMHSHKFQFPQHITRVVYIAVMHFGAWLFCVCKMVPWITITREQLANNTKWEAGRRGETCAGEQPGARFDSSIEKCSKQQDKRGNGKARPMVGFSFCLLSMFINWIFCRKKCSCFRGNLTENHIIRA